MSYQLRLPKKSDYPGKLSVLDKSTRSAEYLQLIEASASAYFETKGPAKWLFMKRFKSALAYLDQIGKVDKILDVGTGIGYFLPSLAQFAKSVIAIDYADHTLRYAKGMCKNLKIKNVVFQKKDLFAYQFKANQFNIINALSVLEHIPPDKLNKLMKQFKKALKPGGYLIAGYPNEGNLIFKLIQQAEKILLRPKVFKSLKDDERDYKPLGHVALSRQIDESIRRQFKIVDYQSLPLPGLKFYSMVLAVKE